MMRHLYKTLLFFAFALPLSSMAQSLEIVQHFKMDEYATVLTTYKNEFGHRQKKGIDDSFPFAVLEVNLEGDERSVTLAKEKITLNLGTQYMVEGLTKEYNNKIVFLISSRLRNVYMECGDGCKEQVIFEGMQLQPDRIYYGSVRYIPSPVESVVATTQAPKRQFFMFEVTPSNAIVSVVENGEKKRWQLVDGVASNPLNHGTYAYSVSAQRYYTEEGVFTVSDTEREKKISLKPKFGWLTINGTSDLQGAHVYVTSTKTDEEFYLGAVPITAKDLDVGEYSLLIQKEKYKDYTSIFTISENQTSSLSPSLLPNFARLTLTTIEGADILIDEQRIGTTIWSGTLEIGEYNIECRKAGHKSAYTTVEVNAQTTGKSIVLNAPIPIYGSLMVQGTPAGASVYLDGLLKGKTPIILNDVLVGSHQVRMEKDEYEKQEQTIQITEGKEEVIAYELENVSSQIFTPASQSVITPVRQSSASIGNKTFTVNGVSFTMVAVEGGTFRMGGTYEQGNDVEEDEKPIHHVNLSNYMIGETEVTQELWQAVMGKTLQEYADYKIKGNQEHPMYYVSWEDCQEFITELNALTGENFRLPTEAEWEYAARGGQKSMGYKYAGGNKIGKVGWYTFNANTMRPVRKKLPNELGLYDMTGNVLEWCHDWYDSYSSVLQVDPQGPATGTCRVSRGGSSWFYAWSCRISDRFYSEPFKRIPYCGLRLALSLEQIDHQNVQPIAKVVPTDEKADEHEYVDLGLSVKWATCNVGASKPEDYGDYFAWGETQPKNTYNWSTYKWCKGTQTTLTKYNKKSKCGSVDEKTTLDLSDDAAHANWGGSWRMPTKEEQDELCKKCTWKWVIQNGVNGYKVTSRKNGNSIFLPVAGYRDNSDLYYVGSLGGYWSSWMGAGNSVGACGLYFTFGKAYWVGNSVRNYGRSVRPVCP